MFKYFPHTEKDIQEMLLKIGVKTLDDLFLDVPEKLKRPDYQVPNAMSELELRRHFNDIVKGNKELIIFRGAGAYDHYTPSIIPQLVRREEFLTAYTPYQPEIAQGTLQYIFEFQSMITDLTGMDVTNASMYDGSTAAAEAMFMAVAQTKKQKILVSNTVFNHVLEVVKTYAFYRNIEVVLVNEKEGITDIDDLKQKSIDSAGFISQVPNKYGIIEDITPLSMVIKEASGLSIIHADPQVLSVIKSPREMGADIACGECQTLGVPLSFGGAYIGYLATTDKLLRKMPGRICGITNDVDGKRGFVLTLQAREQHIRREKANSNICSNQSLMALWVTIYLSIMGKKGLEEVNDHCYTNSHYLEEKLLETKLFKRVYQGFFLKEFLLETTLDIDKLETYLIKKGFLSGLKVSENKILFSATEKRTRQEIDAFVEAIRGFSK
ncbi:MAG: aminomethyl-transferring glycine dehydrogenase subunit GcvPA [Acholeplasma sp.]|nr:aminomethyl-transferring glycine dehydrogenase subunit GcvPA [Acholeplasma sp.]